MDQETNKSTSLQRITVVDALRGFALLGVILTHMLQHYGIFSFPIEQREALFPNLDEAVQWIMQNVLMGKFINIFAFLFGLSFFIQMDRATQKGIDFRKRFLWRMLILFVVGIIGNCFYTGDILSIYAVFGILMVVLYKVKNWILILIASLLLIGMPRIVTSSYDQLTKTKQAAIPNINQNSNARPQLANIEKPSFLNSAKNNLTRGLQGKLNYQFGMFARGYITLALFVLGLIIGRLRFFEQVHIQKKKNRLLFFGFVSACILINYSLDLLPEPASTRAILMGLQNSDITLSLFITMALRDIYAVLLSGAFVMGFIILYQIKGIGNWLEKLTPYGRMGLTNYELQNIIGCFIFSTWAFGATFSGWGATQVFVLGLAVYAMQVVISRYWLKHFLYGPLEWFWRSATYLKLEPLKRKS